MGFLDGLVDGDAVVGESVGISDGVSVGEEVFGAAVGCHCTKVSNDVIYQSQVERNAVK